VWSRSLGLTSIRSHANRCGSLGFLDTHMSVVLLLSTSGLFMASIDESASTRSMIDCRVPP
jgi:hypothetical protein